MNIPLYNITNGTDTIQIGTDGIVMDNPTYQNVSIKQDGIHLDYDGTSNFSLNKDGISWSNGSNSFST
jgi:hypothetical protein